MRIRRWTRPLAASAAVALVLTSMAGCYGYYPVSNPAPGTEVRVSVPLRTNIQGRRTEETATFEGILLSNGDTVVVQTRTRQQADLFREFLQTDTVRVASESVVRLDERRFSTTRTVLFTAVAVTGVVLFAMGVEQIAGGSTDGDGGGGTTPTQTRVPLLTLPIGGR